MFARVMLLAVPLLLLGSAPVGAAEPERLAPEVFDVVALPSGSVEVTFALSLSEVSTYPVTITAIRGETEERLWEGSLQAGFYRLGARLTKISGPGPLRVVLRTKVVNRSAQGASSFLVYLKWDGSL